MDIDKEVCFSLKACDGEQVCLTASSLLKSVTLSRLIHDIAMEKMEIPIENCSGITLRKLCEAIYIQ